MENHYMHTGSRMPRKSLILPELTGLRSPGLPTGMTLRRMMKELTLFLIFFWSTAASLHAQTLTGTVTDAEGEPLIGVNIQVKGTTTGTATDFNGRFTLEGVAEDAVLTVSYVGYQTQEVAVTGQTELAITLLSDVQLLDEVVVVGYGTQKKINMTGAVTQLDAKELENRPVTNLTQALQGAVPNLNIVIGSGKPGTTGTLNIRGNTSITSSGDPLVLIDGVPGDIDRINVNDVESISVLKDASASAIYGARAAFGVILITTKNATTGTPVISYSNNFGWTTVSLRATTGLFFS